MEQKLYEILQNLSSQNLFVVCLLIFVAAVLQFVFPPMPSDVLLVALGILAGTGTFNGWATCLTYAFGAMVGSFALYAVCYYFGDKVLKWKLIRKMISDDGFDVAKRKIEKFGGPALLLMRFIPSLQVVALIAFGVTKYPKSKLLFYIPAVSLFSSAVFFFIGYFLADNVPKMLKILSVYSELGWIFLGVIAALVIGCLCFIKIRKSRKK